MGTIINGAKAKAATSFGLMDSKKGSMMLSDEQFYKLKNKKKKAKSKTGSSYFNKKP